MCHYKISFTLGITRDLPWIRVALRHIGRQSLRCVQRQKSHTKYWFSAYSVQFRNSWGGGEQAIVFKGNCLISLLENIFGGNDHFCTQSYRLCLSCTDRIVLYHQLFHIRYELFKICQTKIKDYDLTDVPAAITACLDDHEWKSLMHRKVFLTLAEARQVVCQSKYGGSTNAWVFQFTCFFLYCGACVVT